MTPVLSRGSVLGISISTFIRNSGNPPEDPPEPRLHKTTTPQASHQHLTLSSTGLDEKDIAVLDDVILTLSHDLTLRLDGSFVAQFLERGVVIDESLNESLLEIYESC